MGNIKELLKLFLFFWRIRAATVLGGYPYPEKEKDGYFQRIKVIDTLFTDGRRIFIDRTLSSENDAWLDQPTRNTFVIRVGKAQKSKWVARFFMILCFFRSKTIYIHSIYPLRGLSFIMYIPGGKKIVDMHGAAPEELHYRGNLSDSKDYERVEEYAVKKATHLVFVSEAMRQHFAKKYPKIPQYQTVLLPIFPKIPSPHSKGFQPLAGAINKTYPNGKPVIVYAGGLQEWQQVPKMINAIKKTIDITTHKFFCPQPELMREMLSKEGLSSPPSILVDSKSHDELLKIYFECHYGFILRKNNIVNNVACPTKLVEYLAMGIIPIVDYEGIGDFKTLGMQFLRLEDFLQGKLPDEDERNMMAAQNLAVYNRLEEEHLDGMARLKVIGI
jgi:hypothetical protein